MKGRDSRHSAHGDIPRDVLEATLGAIRARYSMYPNVIGVGSGLKFKNGRHVEGTICIHFYVRSKVDFLPRQSRLPHFVYARTPNGKTLHSMRLLTDVVELPALRFAQSSGAQIYVTGESGTITMVFANLAESATSRYMITCAHVTGNLTQSPPVDPIISDRWGVPMGETIVNSTQVGGVVRYDIALARLAATYLPNAGTAIEGVNQGLQRFMAASDIHPGMYVDCAFPVSNVASATVASHRTTLPVILNGHEYMVENLFLINRTPMGGDSGGLLYCDGAAIGILVAISDGFGLFQPLDEAFEHLQNISPTPIRCF